MELTVKHVISIAPETQDFFKDLITGLLTSKPATATQPEAPKTRSSKKAEEPKVVDPEAKPAEKVTAPVIETPAPVVVEEEDDLLGDTGTAEITADALYKLCVPYLQGDNTAPAVKALFAPLREKHGIKKIMDIPDGARAAFHAAVIALPKPII